MEIYFLCVINTEMLHIRIEYHNIGHSRESSTTQSHRVAIVKVRR